jgi:hypothetical protein
MRHLHLVLSVTIFALLASAAPGFAAVTRYAAPTPTGLADCSSLANACSLATAISGVAVDGAVSVAPGAYGSINNLVVPISSTGVTIYGVPGATTTISGSGVNPVLRTTDGTVVRDLQFDVATSGDPSIRADGTSGVLLERVSLTNSANYPALRMGSDTVVRDSLITINPTLSGFAAVSGGGGSIYNSTVVSNPPSGGYSLGIARACPADAGLSLDIRNTIIVGSGSPGYGIALDQSVPCALPTTARNSYIGGGIDDSAAFLMQSEAISVAPTLDSAFKQMPGSSTIDRGAVSSIFAGELSLFGSARCLGNAPDVGADEFAGGPCPPPARVPADTKKPLITLLKAVKKKGKLKCFTFTSSEAGTATLKYQRRKGKNYKSAGSQAKTVKAGKNTVKPKKLKKGSYKLTLTVKDAAGNVSVAKRLTFKIK